MSNPRQPAHPVAPMFVNRWSPRALTGEAITREQLNTVLEAARWAPSAFNYQPWRFIYALRDTAQWGPIFEGVKEGNRTWVKDGSALIVLASAKNAQFPGRDAPGPNAWHAFDTGAAWISMALQASHMGLVAHALAGFDPAVTQREQDGKVIYRVRVGPYDTKSQAEQIQTQLKSNKFESALIRVQR